MTLPVGVPETLVTVAPKVTDAPNVDGFSDEVRAVVVAGLFTVNAFVSDAVPPPGALFVTETVRAPGVAPDPIVMFAVICVALFTVVVFTVMFAPKLTELTPLMKLLPVKTTSSVCEIFPLVGAMDVSVGAGLLMLKSALVAGTRPVDVAASV